MVVTNDIRPEPMVEVTAAVRCEICLDEFAFEYLPMIFDCLCFRLFCVNVYNYNLLVYYNLLVKGQVTSAYDRFYSTSVVLHYYSWRLPR